jgi:hypothetical protein
LWYFIVQDETTTGPRTRSKTRGSRMELNDPQLHQSGERFPEQNRHRNITTPNVTRECNRRNSAAQFASGNGATVRQSRNIKTAIVGGDDNESPSSPEPDNDISGSYNSETDSDNDEESVHLAFVVDAVCKAAINNRDKILQHTTFYDKEDNVNAVIALLANGFGRHFASTPTTREHKIAKTLTQIAADTFYKTKPHKYDESDERALKANSTTNRPTIDGHLIDPTIHEAMRDEVLKPKWIEAIDKEMKQLYDMGVITEVERKLIQGDKKLLGCRWVLHIKTEPDPEKSEGARRIEWLKARLVVQGFTQRFGVNYDDTSSPVLKHSTLRWLASVAASNGLQFSMFDITGAYLNAPVEHELYMRMPPGFNRDKGDHVLRLNKALYGLKQAGREWYEMFRNFLVEAGFTQTHADPCLYQKEINDQIVLVGVYVDDLVTVSSEEHVKAFHDQLLAKFEVRNLGDVKYCLGIQCHRDTDGSVFLYQQKFIVEVLERFKSHLEDLKPVDIPMMPLTGGPEDPTLPIREDEPKLDVNMYPYNELIGSLMYMVVCTRPNFNFATSVLSRHLKNPAMRHFKAAIRILQYLMCTSHYGIYFSANADPNVEGYSDAAESNHPRLLAQTGVEVMRAGGPVIFYSHRQTLTKLSIADAEMVALNELVQDLLHMGYMHDDTSIKTKRPIQAWTNNLALAKRCNGEVSTYENRAVSRRDFFCKDQVKAKNVMVNWKDGASNPADMFTKPLTRIPFDKHCAAIGMKALVGEGSKLKIVELKDDPVRITRSSRKK